MRPRRAARGGGLTKMHSDRWFAAFEDRPAYLATKVSTCSAAPGGAED